MPTKIMSLCILALGFVLMIGGGGCNCNNPNTNPLGPSVSATPTVRPTPIVVNVPNISGNLGGSTNVITTQAFTASTTLASTITYTMEVINPNNLTSNTSQIYVVMVCNGVVKSALGFSPVTGNIGQVWYAYAGSGTFFEWTNPVPTLTENSFNENVQVNVGTLNTQNLNGSEVGPGGWTGVSASSLTGWTVSNSGWFIVIYTPAINGANGVGISVKSIVVTQ